MHELNGMGGWVMVILLVCLLYGRWIMISRHLGFPRKFLLVFLEGMTGVASGLCTCMFQPLE